MLNMVNGVDYFVLEKLHELALHGGTWLTPCMKIISLFGDKGLFVAALSLFFIIYPKTRKVGICMLLAVAIGTVLGNGILKNLVGRSRPFTDQNSPIYDWWLFVGASEKNSYSFPSGHVMVIAAAIWSCYLINRKKGILVLLCLLSFLMGLSRCYLMVHYFSDVVGGFLIGILSATISYQVIKKVKIIERG